MVIVVRRCRVDDHRRGSASDNVAAVLAVGRSSLLTLRMVCRRRHSPCLGPSYRLLPVPIIRNCRTRVHLVHSREDRQHSQLSTRYGRQATSSDSSKHPSRALRCLAAWLVPGHSVRPLMRRNGRLYWRGAELLVSSAIARPRLTFIACCSSCVSRQPSS